MHAPQASGRMTDEDQLAINQCITRLHYLRANENPPDPVTTLAALPPLSRWSRNTCHSLVQTVIGRDLVGWLQAMVVLGVDPAVKKDDGRNPAWFVALKGESGRLLSGACCRWLLDPMDVKVDVQASAVKAAPHGGIRDVADFSPLHWASRTFCPAESFRLLFAAGADPDEMDPRLNLNAQKNRPSPVLLDCLSAGQQKMLPKGELLEICRAFFDAGMHEDMMGPDGPLARHVQKYGALYFPKDAPRILSLMDETLARREADRLDGVFPKAPSKTVPRL